MDRVAKGKFLVLQALAARMMGNSQIEDARNLNWVRPRFGGHGWMDSHFAWQAAMDHFSRPEVERLLVESRQAWVASMKEIVAKAGVPTILLWWAERPPHYLDSFENATTLFNGYPQLVNQAMIEELKPLCAGYAEAVSSRGRPHFLRSEFTGEITSVLFGGGRPEEQYWLSINHYYPSPEMHEDAAAALLPAIRAAGLAPTA